MDLQPNLAGSIPAPGLAPRVDAKAIARERLAARRQRIRRVRRTVAAAALSTFAALWTVLYVQLASGHDPALSVKVALTAVKTPAPMTPTVSSAAASATASNSSTNTAMTSSTATVTPTTAAAAPAPAAVTTRQS